MSELTAETVAALVNQELIREPDPAVIRRIRALLVKPKCVDRAWDYGGADSYPCWTVVEHPGSNTGIVYCDEGFGPNCPWGLVWLSGKDTGMGMDCGWYATLVEAFKESMFADNE
ncbi:MAG: hypothetical protein AAGA25_00160 [Planctomycetota bacterium]